MTGPIIVVADEPDRVAIAGELQVGSEVAFRSWADEPRLCDAVALLLVAPRQPGVDFAWRACAWMQLYQSQLRSCRGWLVAVTQCGGDFSFDGGPVNGVPGLEVAALWGLVKTAHHEWSEVCCKVIDWDGNGGLGDELFSAGPLEVALKSGRFGIDLVAELQAAAPPLDLPAGSLVLVSGGARGVTAAAAIELAREFSPTLVLLGRSPLPEPEPDEWVACRTEVDLKRAIIGSAGGTKPSPRDIEAQCRRLLAAREIRDNLAAISAAGTKVDYAAIDVRNRSDVNSLVSALRAKYGPVRGIVHGAGVLADKRIEDKTHDAFDSVFRTKVDGWQNLVAATAGDPLAFVALFSSSTARFGRTGQCDYAAANEVLNLAARRLAATRPHCRTVAFNWGPWEGGMVTPGLRALFASEGVGLIPLDDGARFMAAELSGRNGPADVVVLGPPEPWSVKISLDEPVLRAHRFDGKGVVPASLAQEWIIDAALRSWPGQQLVGCDELRVLAPLAVEDGLATDVAAKVGPPVKRGNETVIAVELCTHRPCYRAKVRLAEAAAIPPVTFPAPAGGISISCREAYDRHLFHSPLLHLIEGDVDLSGSSARATAKITHSPRSWLRPPVRERWRTSPAALDAAFQMMILWCIRHAGAPSLPVGWAEYLQFGPWVGETAIITARITSAKSTLVRADIDFECDARLAARIRGFECVVEPRLVELFARERGVSE